jgi:hypothetical protein
MLSGLECILMSNFLKIKDFNFFFFPFEGNIPRSLLKESLRLGVEPAYQA